MGGSTIHGGNSASLQAERERERECMHAMAFINYLPKSILRDSSHQLEVKLTPMHMNLLFFWRSRKPQQQPVVQQLQQLLPWQPLTPQ